MLVLIRVPPIRTYNPLYSAFNSKSYFLDSFKEPPFRVNFTQYCTLYYNHIEQTFQGRTLDKLGSSYCLCQPEAVS